MSEKKLNEEELKDVSGGAKFSISGQKTWSRSKAEEPRVSDSAKGVILDPWGGPQNDPIYSDVAEKPEG